MKKMSKSNASYAAISSWPAATLSSPIMMLSIMLAASYMILFSTTTAVSAFSTPSCHLNNNRAPRATIIITSMQLMASSTINDDTPNTNTNTEMRELGNSIILAAARFHGATDKMVSIDWKADRIVVTVDVARDEEFDGDSVVGELEEFDDDEDEFDDEDFDDEEEFDEDDFDDEEFDDEDFSEDFEEEEDFEALQAQLGLQPQDSSSPPTKKIDLTLIARTINEYLSADGENTPQFKIAQLHEIEVTTPEFDNVLRKNENGVDMFEVYKGFDVIVDYWEVPKKKKKKKKKSGKADKEIVDAADEQEEEEEEEEEPTRTQKIIEGKLVGRDDEKDVTMINVKGRIMKIKNDMIESVKLPKAKREKGVK